MGHLGCLDRLGSSRLVDETYFHCVIGKLPQHDTLRNFAAFRPKAFLPKCDATERSHRSTVI